MSVRVHVVMHWESLENCDGRAVAVGLTHEAALTYVARTWPNTTDASSGSVEAWYTDRGGLVEIHVVSVAEVAA